MPRCPNGHDAGLTLSCEQCGSPIPYRDLLTSLATLPSPSISFDEVAVASVGVPRLDLDGVYSCEVLAGQKEEVGLNSLTLEKIGGGTWLDYYKTCRRRLGMWLGLVGFERSRYKLIAADTTDPLSVLFLSSLSSVDGAIVLAMVADESSTPLKQNTSFTALEVLKQKGLPYIAVGESYVDEMTVLAEDEDLYSGTGALEVLAEYLVANIRELQDFLRRDLRLGIKAHYLFTMMSASSIVYNTPSDVFKVMVERPSVSAGSAEHATAYMIASSTADEGAPVREAFEAYSRSLRGLIGSDSVSVVKGSALGLFDIFVIIGVSEPRIQSSLEEGYQVVARTSGDLKVGELEKAA